MKNNQEYIVPRCLGISAYTYNNFEKSENDSVNYKPNKVHKDISTNLDIEINNAILDFLNKKSIPLLSEELGNIKTPPKDGSAYILLDPLDGTHNYSSGIEMYGTSVCLIKDNYILDSGLSSLSSGISVFTKRDKNKNKLVKSRSFPSQKIRNVVQPLIIAHGSNLNSSQKDLLSEISFFQEGKDFPGIHRIGSSVEAFLGFIQQKYSSFLAVGTRPWDLASAIHIAKHLEDTEVLISKNDPLNCVFIYRKDYAYTKEMIPKLEKYFPLNIYEINEKIHFNF